MAFRAKSDKEGSPVVEDIGDFHKNATIAAANAQRPVKEAAKGKTGKMDIAAPAKTGKGKAKTTVATVVAEKKKVSDSKLVEMANEQQGGKSKPFLEDVRSLETLQDQRRDIGDKIKAKRNYLKDNYRVELRALDIVVRDRRMKPEVVEMRDLNVANYKKQLGMDLSSYQQKLVEEEKTKIEQTRRALGELHGEDAGKEVGSRKNAIKPEEKLDEDHDKPIEGPVESEASGVVH